ncbi:MAG: hypothetical protein WC307_00575 [Candidatus Nanoarchaeia archaeon]|jgi:hypothetical protein
MFEVFIQGTISGLLFIAGSLLIQWKKELKSDEKLIRRFGIGIIIIGAYELVNMLVNLYSLNNVIYSYHKIIELIGLAVIMFSLFNYLEVKK